jgi:hypothetical protein
VRAIEQRRWLVRASTSGPSAIIDPTGRVTAETAPFSRATVAGGVAGDGVTPYARWGDVFGLLCVAAVVVGLVKRAVRNGARRSFLQPATQPRCIVIADRLEADRATALDVDPRAAVRVPVIAGAFERLAGFRE